MPWSNPRLIALALAAMLVLSGCDRSGDAVHLAVVYSPQEHNAPPIDSATAISGGDKSGWYGQAAGTTHTDTLYPGPDSGDRELTLLYTLSGQARRVWEGPKIPFGKGYRIRVEIDANGTVSSYRHCLLPCTLD